MSGPPTASQEVRRALAGAYGAAVRSPAVGTEHLLGGLAGPIGELGTASSVLASVEVTTTVVLAVLRRRGSHGWRSDDGADDAELPPASDQEWFQAFEKKPTGYTAAARAALHRAAAVAAEDGLAEVHSGHLLQGLLADEDNRAVELLRGCGVDPASLRERLRGTDPVAEAEDPVPPELRHTRDALLGKPHYPSNRVTWRTINALFRIWPVAEIPTVWVRLETPEQARRLGMRKTGTEHLVLAILAVTETLQTYPHLRPDDAAYRYLAGEVLAEAGLTYHRAREAVRAHPERLGRDARKWSSVRQPGSHRQMSGGTGELLLAVLSQDDSRGANLLRQMGIAPAAIRAALRTGLRQGAGDYRSR